jgi:hypothetical protein
MVTLSFDGVAVFFGNPTMITEVRYSPFGRVVIPDFPHLGNVAVGALFVHT